jgi:hypothetical protein
MNELHLTEDFLDRMVRAVEKVRERLNRAVSALEGASIPYAVAGENAVAAWVATVDEAAVRNTRQVDFLVNRADLEAVKVALSNAGFVFRTAKRGGLFLDGPGERDWEALHIVFAGERVRSTDTIAAPEVSDSEVVAALRVVALEPLVKMNLTSFRNLERMLLHDMIGVGLVDDSWLPKLPEELAARLTELLENPEG